MKQPTKVLTCQTDRCFLNPGEYLAVYCGVCGQCMTVERNVMGPTGFAEAMSVHIGRSQGHLHDRFRCPDSQTAWHQQAQAIRENAHHSPSKRLTDFLTEEADEIVRTRKNTKHVC